MASRILTTLWLMLCATAVPALAEDASAPRGVVEMFTAQGCASCPPADRAMEQLAKRTDVIALSYHVDYWNYLGWVDTLASPENTARQYGYARTLGRSGVYTPQAVLNGRDHMPGNDELRIRAKLQDMGLNGGGLTIPVVAKRRNDEIDIDIGAGNGKADVVVVYFKRQQTVDVLKGENEGQRISYWNNVTDIQTIGMWNGGELNLVLPAKLLGDGRNTGCAVLLQTTGPTGAPAAIIGAAVIMPQKQDCRNGTSTTMC